MSKNARKTAREKLIGDARAKFEAAAEKLKAAQIAFEAVEEGKDRTNEQAAINAAAEELERYEKALEALVAKENPSQGAADGEAGADGFGLSGTLSFICRGAIRHSGVDYKEGDVIELDRKAAEQLGDQIVLDDED